jgi:hypothetical protein
VARRCKADLEQWSTDVKARGDGTDHRYAFAAFLSVLVLPVVFIHNETAQSVVQILGLLALAAAALWHYRAELQRVRERWRYRR